MAGLLATVFTATVTAVAVTVGTSATVGPRLAARSKRIQAAHDNRDRFNDTVMQILALCFLLTSFKAADDLSSQAKNRVEDERDRWISGLDAATQWLVDNLVSVGGTYLNLGGIPGMAVNYAVTCRALWVSDRSLEERVRLIAELTDPLQTTFFASLPLYGKKKISSLNTLQTVLARYEVSAD